MHFISIHAFTRVVNSTLGTMEVLMSRYLATFCISVAGTLFTIASVVALLCVRSFFLSGHFCPACGSSNGKLYVFLDGYYTHGKQCSRCGTAFYRSSDDRSWRNRAGRERYSLRFPNDWCHWFMTNLRWHTLSIEQ